MTNNLSETLKALLDEHSVTPEKLASTTNIPLRFIVALVNGDLSKLPSAPYVRGYLKKIAPVLHTDPDELIEIYKSSDRIIRSGESDKLPDNRFNVFGINRGVAITIAIVLILTAFLIFRFDAIFGVASLEVNIPETVSEELYTVAGSITPGDQLTLNDEIIYTDETGKFEKEMMLFPGLNKLEFKVKRFLGQERTIQKQIYYEPQNND